MASLRSLYMRRVPFMDPLLKSYRLRIHVVPNFNIRDVNGLLKFD